MEKKEIFCDECEAAFKVMYDLDYLFYTVSFCPFCGFSLEKEDVIDDNDDDLRDEDDDAFYRDEDEDHF